MILNILISLSVIFGQIFKHPSDMREVISGSFVDGVHLSYPVWYTLFAPFFHVADRLTILSMNQHWCMLAAVNFIWILSRVVRWNKESFTGYHFARAGVVWVGLNVFYLVLYAAVVLIPRPMARLEVRDPDLLVYDTHSHTKFSWDGNSSFTPEKNLIWHRNAGFHATFITDHNVETGTVEGRNLSLEGNLGIRSLRGEEVSLHQCHVVALGIRRLIPNQPFDGNVEGIQKFFGQMKKTEEAFVIASLPEYWKYHWDRREDFVKWGVRGFEVVNSPPVSLDFPPSMRKEIIRLCKENRLVMTGATDNHGWGSTVYAWNVSRIPGWRAMSTDDLESAVLKNFRENGDLANQIFVRVKAEPQDGRLWMAADPFLQVWEAARTLPWNHAASVLIWIWVPWLRNRKKKQ